LHVRTPNIILGAIRLKALQIIMLSATLVFPSVSSGQLESALPPTDSGEATLEALVDVLGTGDQAAIERFAGKYFAPKTLQEFPAADVSAWLARTYTDTGGLAIEGIAGETPDWVQAEAHARITGIHYCLTLRRKTEGGRTFITDFDARDLYPAGPQLQAPTPRELKSSLEQLIDAYVARGLFSGVVLMAKDDRVFFRKTYGKANAAGDVPITLNTRLNIASIGKMFTATAILQLVESGKLSLDDRLEKVLPDYSNEKVRKQVTIRQLLTHTSGLGPQDYYDHPDYPAQRDKIRTVADLMRFAVATPLGAEPGKYLYSNSGYIILGAVIERLSGQSFYEYLQRHIFKPAGMKRSLYAPGDLLGLNTAAALTNFHERDKTPGKFIYRLGPLLESQVGMGGPFGGAWVTADDLFAFSKALRGGKLVKPETFRLMTTPQGPTGAGAPGLTGQAQPGLGVEVVTRNGHTFFGHTGGDFGIASFLYWYPDSGYTTILLSNRDPRAARIVLNVTRAVLTRQTIGGAWPAPQTCIPPGPQEQ
jgi:CubicO group peptidase (beta-lactamase class C family)